MGGKVPVTGSLLLLSKKWKRPIRTTLAAKNMTVGFPIVITKSYDKNQAYQPEPGVKNM